MLVPFTFPFYAALCVATFVAIGGVAIFAIVFLKRKQ